MKRLCGNSRSFKQTWLVSLFVLACACGSETEKYTVNSDGTVSDNETGLTWQYQADLGRFTQAQAIAHCSALRLANTQWSLPTLDELLTIREAFPDQPGAEFWTSDPPHPSDSTRQAILYAWTFAPSEDGSGGPDFNEPKELFRARCVSHIKR